MKWYPHGLHRQHLKDIKVKRGDLLELYYPWVSQIANTFARDSVAIGALNYMDLYQAGYIGLIEAYDTVDPDKSQAETWSYIKKRIKWAIRREIDKHGSFIAQPINKQEQQRNNLELADKILVNSYPKFFDMMMFSGDINHGYSWHQEQLAELIDNLLYQYVPNVTHRLIVSLSFGIDTDKAWSMKKLASYFDTTPNYINQLKRRVISNLQQNEDFKQIINKFYEN